MLNHLIEPYRCCVCGQRMALVYEFDRIAQAVYMRWQLFVLLI